MMVAVALTAQAIADISVQVLPESGTLLQRSVGDLLRSHSVVVLANLNEKEAIHNLLSSNALTPTERQRWMGLISSLIQNGRMRLQQPPADLGPNAVANASDLELFGQESRSTLVALSVETYGKLFSADSSHVELTPDLVAAKLASLLDIPAVDARRQLADFGQHSAGSRRDTVWIELFDFAAREARHIRIFDPYLFATLARRDSEGAAGDPEHLVWLMGKIDAVGRAGVKVTLFSALDPRRGLASGADLAAILKRHWRVGSGAISSVNIVSANLTGRPDKPHNRHIRFDSTAGFVLFEGLDRLREPTLWSAEGFGWAYKWTPDALESMRQRERSLELTPDSTSEFLS